MSETKHTPTPYIVGPTGIADERGDMLIMADLGNRCIESIGRLWNTHSRAEANAQFIITACNAFEPLVKTCEETRNHLQYLANGGDPTVLGADLEDALCCICDALETAMAAAGVKE